MDREEVNPQHRRKPPKRQTECISKFEQLIACEFAVTFDVEIPDVELINITCMDD